MLSKSKDVGRKSYATGGDKGETGLFGSKTIPKDSPRVEAYGTIDEINSAIGVAISTCTVEKYTGVLMHEIAHAIGGAPDVTREFEIGLTDLTGEASSKALDGGPRR